jgi:3-hydroxybutyryl-CoA dehydrogenase
MGSSISLTLALGGMDVFMYGRTPESVNRGMGSINSFCRNLVRSSLYSESEMEAIRKRIHPSTDLGDSLKEVTFVSEAISEDPELKQELFAKIETMVPEDAMITSATSGLDPDIIGQKLSSRARFLVAHFSNPAHLMPFVELVPCGETSPDSMEFARDLLLKVGLRPVCLDRYIPGFVFNRLQFALLRESMYLVEQGIVTPEELDGAVTHGLGRRLAYTGPLRSADMGGLDVFNKIASYLLPELCSSGEVSRVLSDPAANGDLGCKTGRGIFEWNEEEIDETNRKREHILILLAKQFREDL